MAPLAKHGKKAPETSEGDDSPSLVSVPQLTALKRTSGDLDRFMAQVLALKTTDTLTLILRISTTTDPLLLWAIHIALSGREIPPPQRWPSNTSTDQHRYITWLADLHWFHKKNPDHVPKFKLWQRFMPYQPGCGTWHTISHIGYLQLAHTVSYGSALALALTPAQRLDSMTLTSDATNKARLSLQPKAFEAVRQALTDHAYANLDPSKRRKPEESANRRASIWRVYLLSGRNKTETARIWQLLTGEKLTRQAASVLLKKIAIVVHDKAEK